MLHWIFFYLSYLGHVYRRVQLCHFPLLLASWWIHDSVFPCTFFYLSNEIKSSEFLCSYLSIAFIATYYYTAPVLLWVVLAENFVHIFSHFNVVFAFIVYYITNENILVFINGWIHILHDIFWRVDFLILVLLFKHITNWNRWSTYIAISHKQ